MLWRDMRGRTKEIHKEFQDLDSLCSPHIEGRWIGGNIDLDLLSLLPQKYARIMGGMEEGGQAFKVNNGGERNSFRAWLKEEEGVFIPPSSKNLTVAVPGVDYPGQIGAEYLPPPPGLFGQKSAQTSAPITRSEPAEIRESSTQKR
jgi:hypothetical protein